MDWFKGKKVVVPIDFGNQSQPAIDAALSMVENPSDLFVIHVAPDLTALAPEVVWQELSDEARAKTITENFREEYENAKYKELNFEVAFGDPGHQITEFVKDLGADVIIMPSHGRSGMSRLLLGSVAERVLRLAHCPVFVLKE